MWGLLVTSGLPSHVYNIVGHIEQRGMIPSMKHFRNLIECSGSVNHHGMRVDGVLLALNLGR